MAVPAETIHIDNGRAMQLCKRIRQNMTDARSALVELYEGKGWAALGYPTWRECVAAEFGEHQRTLYRHLEAALVLREIEQAADPVFDTCVKSSNQTLSERSLTSLAKAPAGTRAEVLKIATEAAGGKPTEAVVKAAVEAKLETPEATPQELVKVVEAKAKPPRAVVPEAVEEIREERAEQAAKRDEVTDEEWLGTLPLSSVLEGHSLDKFRRDALDYRDMESTIPSNVPLRKAVAEFLSRAKRRQKGRTHHQGFTAYRAGLLLSVEHPRAWFQCPSTEKGGCGGSGTVGSIGQCPMCFGRGYLPR